MRLQPGASWGSYTIERILGEGGAGIVYLASQSRPRRQVAIKVLNERAAADPAFRTRFKREAQLAASIEHPNVVPIYEVGEVGDVPYIAMRFIDGQSLAELIACDAPLGTERALRIVSQIAEALDALHAAGIVHRDIKPANVMVAGEHDDSHLTDFGIARLLSSQTGLTRSQTRMGSIAYMSPEQLRGDPVDARTDVYALGCVLFQLLTGSVPYPRDTHEAQMWATLHAPIPSLRALAKGAPRGLDHVVRVALSRNPDRRFQSAGGLAKAASEATRGRARPGWRHRHSSVARGAATGKWRHHFLIRLAAVAAVMLISAFAASLLIVGDPPLPATPPHRSKSTSQAQLMECGNGVSVGRYTSCGFGLNVATEYVIDGRVVAAVSPAAMKTFQVRCLQNSSRAGLITCRGGVDGSALVVIRPDTSLRCGVDGSGQSTREICRDAAGRVVRLKRRP